MSEGANSQPWLKPSLLYDYLSSVTDNSMLCSSYSIEIQTYDPVVPIGISYSVFLTVTEIVLAGGGGLLGNPGNIILLSWIYPVPDKTEKNLASSLSNYRKASSLNVLLYKLAGLCFLFSGDGSSINCICLFFIFEDRKLSVFKAITKAKATY